MGVTILNMITGEYKLFKSANPSDPVYGSVFYKQNPEITSEPDESTITKLRRALLKVCK